MSSTFSSIHFHLIFAVKYRIGLIDPHWADRLYSYLSQLLISEGQKLLKLGGLNDHVHILFGGTTNKCVADVVRVIKSNSTSFINAQRLCIGRFAWQEGYGVFSVSPSNLGSVQKYIENQPKHHANPQLTFQKEYAWLMAQSSVEPNKYNMFNELE